MNKIIPIFPLKLVVFPHSSYPLHIFEERYKKLTEFSLQNKQGFGIVTSLEDGISEIGVYVIISEIVKEYSSGEIDIIVKGEYRFKRSDLQFHKNGYHLAQIEIYDDVTSRINMNLLKKLKNAFYDVLKMADYSLPKNFWYNVNLSPNKSFKIAEKSGLNLMQQQELLNIREENKRLKYLINHFSDLQEKINRDSTNHRIILGNGYLN